MVILPTPLMSAERVRAENETFASLVFFLPNSDEKSAGASFSNHPLS